MRAFLSHTRVCSEIVCVMFCLRRIETESGFLRMLCASLPWFCVQLDFYAYYTQKFALTRPLLQSTRYRCWPLAVFSMNRHFLLKAQRAVTNTHVRLRKRLAGAPEGRKGWTVTTGGKFYQATDRLTDRPSDRARNFPWPCEPWLKPELGHPPSMCFFKPTSASPTALFRNVVSTLSCFRRSQN